MIKELIENRGVRCGVVGLLGIGMTVSSYRYGVEQDQVAPYGIVPNISMQDPHPEPVSDFEAQQDFFSVISSIATVYGASTSDVVLSGQTNSWTAQVPPSHPAQK